MRRTRQQTRATAVKDSTEVQRICTGVLNSFSSICRRSGQIKSDHQSGDEEPDYLSIAPPMTII
jgi:hypothetical protein